MDIRRQKPTRLAQHFQLAKHGLALPVFEAKPDPPCGDVAVRDWLGDLGGHLLLRGRLGAAAVDAGTKAGAVES